MRTNFAIITNVYELLHASKSPLVLEISIALASVLSKEDVLEIKSTVASTLLLMHQRYVNIRDLHWTCIVQKQPVKNQV